MCLIQTIEGATTYCRPVCHSVLAGPKVTFPSEINKKIDGFAAYETFKIFMSLPEEKLSLLERLLRQTYPEACL